MKYLITTFILTLILGCSYSIDSPHRFAHNLSTGPTPWNHENFDDGDENFQFAIISDLNGGEREGIFEVAFNQLNLLRPEFVLSVGDLIDGGTEDKEQLRAEWSSFDERANKLKAPFFHLGGNHDLTNVIMREFWNENYGPRYYHFIYKNVLFLMLDSEDYTEERMQEIYMARAAYIEVTDGPNPENAKGMEYLKMPERSYGEISPNQSEYFEKVITKYPDVKWTFVLMHKPVWKRDDHGGLGRIEKALNDRPYTVINGHFHNYEYTKRNGHDYIMLGTTGGSQRKDLNGAFDHITWISMDNGTPILANIKLEAILNKASMVPGKTDDMCFQASKCDDNMDY